jgi:hypothetical protein
LISREDYERLKSQDLESRYTQWQEWLLRSLAVMGMRGQGLEGFYQQQVPSRVTPPCATSQARPKPPAIDGAHATRARPWDVLFLTYCATIPTS